MPTVSGKIERIDSRSVKTKFGVSTVWSIVVDGTGYETFRDSVVSQFRVGDDVVIEYEKTKYAPKIVSIARAGEGAGAPGTDQVPDTSLTGLRREALRMAIDHLGPHSGSTSVLDLAREFLDFMLGKTGAAVERPAQEMPLAPEPAPEKKAPAPPKPSGKLTGKPALLQTILKKDNIAEDVVLEWAELNGVARGAKSIADLSDEAIMTIINRMSEVREYAMD